MVPTITFSQYASAVIRARSERLEATTADAVVHRENGRQWSPMVASNFPNSSWKRSWIASIIQRFQRLDAPGGAGPYVTGAAHPGWRAPLGTPVVRGQVPSQRICQGSLANSQGASQTPGASRRSISPRCGERKKGKGEPGALQKIQTAGQRSVGYAHRLLENRRFDVIMCSARRVFSPAMTTSEHRGAHGVATPD